MTARPISRALMAALAAALLLAGMTGRIGVQALDRAMSTHLFAPHQHGIPHTSLPV